MTWEYARQLFSWTAPEERFLVFWEGDVTTSTREKLPPAKRPFPYRLHSVDDKAEKSYAKLIKPFVPASVKAAVRQIRATYRKADSGTDDRI